MCCLHPGFRLRGSWPSFVPSFCCPHRRCPRGPEGAFLHGPIRAGTREAPGGEPAAVGGPVLPRREPHPEERCCQAPAGPRCRHPGPGAEEPVCHWPGETSYGERPLQETHSDGKRRLSLSPPPSLFLSPCPPLSFSLSPPPSLSLSPCPPLSFSLSPPPSTHTHTNKRMYRPMDDLASIIVLCLEDKRRVSLHDWFSIKRSWGNGITYWLSCFDGMKSVVLSFCFSFSLTCLSNRQFFSLLIKIAN